MKLQKQKVAETKRQKVNPKAIMKSYSDKLQGELEVKGVDFFTPTDIDPNGSLNIDRDYLTLPQNITDVPTKELGEYLNAFTQQKVYMRTLVGYAELFCEEARRKYVSASEVRYRELLGSKLSETAKEREVNSDPDVLPVYEEFMDYKNKVKLLNMNISSIEDIVFMLSREVSRRTGDFKDDMRNYNVDNYGGRR